MKTHQSVSLDSDEEGPDAMDMGLGTMVIVGVIIFFTEYRRLIAGILLIGGVLAIEAQMLHWPLARFIVLSGTFIAAGISLLIVDIALTNQNMRARSTLELWRDRGGFRIHAWWSGIVVLVVLIAAYLFDHAQGMSVYVPGVMVTAVLCPILVMAIAYLAVSSHLDRPRS